MGKLLLYITAVSLSLSLSLSHQLSLDAINTLELLLLLLSCVRVTFNHQIESQFQERQESHVPCEEQLLLAMTAKQERERETPPKSGITCVCGTENLALFSLSFGNLIPPVDHLSVCLSLGWGF